MRFVEAKEVTLESLLSRPEEVYKVPDYQRTYALLKINLSQNSIIPY